jgi:hypothetical protein
MYDAAQTARALGASCAEVAASRKILRILVLIAHGLVPIHLDAHPHSPGSGAEE